MASMGAPIGGIKQFDGTGYSNWEFRMKLLLEHHGVLEMLSTIPPVEPTEHATFKKSDVKARNLIVNCLADNVLEVIKEKTTAKEIIDTLRGIYVQSGVASQVQLQRRLRNLKYSGKSALSEFLLDYEKTVSELRNCGGTIQETEVISQLLAAMPDCYQGVVTALDVIFSQDVKAVSLEFVKSKLLMEEARQSKFSDHSGSSEQGETAFAARGNWQQRQGPKGNKKNGRPNKFWYKCYNCGVRGHKKMDCPKLRNQTQNCNLTEQDDDEVCFITPLELSMNAETLMLSDDNHITFVIDSGATNHLVKSCVGQFLSNVRDVNLRVNVAKTGEAILGKRQGNLQLHLESGQKIKIEDVIECENLTHNLLSVRKLEGRGLSVTFGNQIVTIKKGQTVVAKGKLLGNLYILKFQVSTNTLQTNVTCADQDLWHRRMGHSSRYPTDKVCEICQKGKQTALSYKSLPEERKAKSVLEVVSSDVCGPISPASYDGKRYVVSFIDSYSHFTVCYFIEHKHEVLEKFKQYVSMAETKCDCHIKRLRCDNGGEYTSKEFQQFCRNKGIHIQYTIPHNPQQNGIAERFNRTLLEKSRCLMYESDLDKSFWTEAMKTAIYLINRTETSVLENGKTPAEIWYKEKPNLNKIKVFGCKAYVLIPREERQSKLDARSRKMIFMGYTDNGYRVWDPEKKKIVTAKHIMFDENATRNLGTPLNMLESENKCENNIKERDKDKHAESESVCKEENDNSNDSEEQETLRHSRRTRKLPKRLEDYHMSSDIDSDIDESLIAALSAETLNQNVPQTYNEAIAMGQGWKLAIESELEALRENETWEIVPYPANETVIDSKWVFRYKDVNGSASEKARLVARGYQQCDESMDMYAPVARMLTLRILFSLCVQDNLHINQLDVKCAFLNGELKEPVFMKIPDGLNVSKDFVKNNVCKLKRSLYGLRQAPKCWYEKLHSHLTYIGFSRSQSDPCLYFSSDIYLLIHVDDLILVSKTESELKSLKIKLMEKFQMRDLTPVKSNGLENNKVKLKFLGLNVIIKDDILLINQLDLIEKVLFRFNMVNCNTSRIPVQPKLCLVKGSNEEVECNVPYRELVGCLMYIMLGSRPDLCFAISFFSQYQNNYTFEHWKNLKNILRYLKHTKHHCLKYERAKTDNIVSAYVDADFANDVNDRRSITGFGIKVLNNFVFWKTRKQSVVSLSSSESEYIALSDCTKECIFITKLLSEILNKNVLPIVIYEDNQSCIKMAMTLETKRTKHIDVRHHYVRDCVSKNEVVINYIPTGEQIADIFTKALNITKFEYFREKLKVMSLE